MIARLRFVRAGRAGSIGHCGENREPYDHGRDAVRSERDHQHPPSRNERKQPTVPVTIIADAMM